MNALVLLLVIAGGADGSEIEQAFRKDGPKGVVAAAKAIEKNRGAAEAVKLLSQSLRDKNVQLCAASAHALGKMGDEGKRALPELASALGKSEVAEALNALGPGDIPIWLAEAAVGPNHSSDAYRALQMLGVRDERLVPILEMGLRHTDLDIRWHAVVLLGDMGAKAAPARQSLVELLEEEPKREKSAEEFFSPNEVRAKAAYALGCIGAEPDQTLRLLTVMLKHNDPEIRMWSAFGLGQMGNKAKTSIPLLIECLADEKMILKPGGCLWSAHPDHAAATALVGIGPSSIPAIIQALDARQARVRWHAANALWHFGPKAKPAVDALLHCLHDPNAEVRREAANTLGWIMPDAKLLVSEMVRLTRDNDSSVRIQAASTLGCLKPTEAVPIDALIRLLDDPDPGVRGAALESLEEVAPKTAMASAVDRLQKDPDESVRRAAGEVLECLREKQE